MVFEQFKGFCSRSAARARRTGLQSVRRATVPGARVCDTNRTVGDRRLRGHSICETALARIFHTIFPQIQDGRRFLRGEIRGRPESVGKLLLFFFKHSVAFHPSVWEMRARG